MYEKTGNRAATQKISSAHGSRPGRSSNAGRKRVATVPKIRSYSTKTIVRLNAVVRADALVLLGTAHIQSIGFFYSSTADEGSIAQAPKDVPFARNSATSLGYGSSSHSGQGCRDATGNR